MKKNIILLTILLSLSALISAQESVSVKFTAIDQNGNYCPFTALSITNETRGWTETMIYPDTLLVLTNTYYGLDDVLLQKTHIGNAYPNPFNTETYVGVELSKAEDVHFKVIYVDGSEAVSSFMHLTAGIHNVIIRLAKPGMAFLVVTTNGERQVVKLLNLEASDNNSIMVNTISSLTSCKEEVNTRYNALGEFAIGDMMSYYGETVFASNTISSETVLQEQYEDDIVLLRFSLPIPTVYTNNITYISQTMVLASGSVEDDGGSTVYEKGVCWSLFENPSLDNGLSNHSNEGGGIGAYTSLLSDLTPNTTYYVRAYATNNNGIAYGEQISFSTTHVNKPIELCTTWGLSHNDVVAFGNTYNVIDNTEDVVAFSATSYSRDTLMMYLFESDSLYCTTIMISSDYCNYDQLANDLLEGYFFMETQNEVDVFMNENQTTVAVAKNNNGEWAISWVALPQPVIDTTITYTGVISGHDYVDLGLSVKWATCNIGADIPENIGYYFQWGEPFPEINGPYQWYTYAYWTDLNGNGYVEPDTEIDMLIPDISGTSYDAANAMWGQLWRMPTSNEIQELINNCQFESVVMSGNNCIKITGPNGQCIYMPATGRKDGQNTYGTNNAYIWSSIRGPFEDEAYCGVIKSSGSNIEHYLKCKGLTIRPVSEHNSYFSIAVSTNMINGGTVNGGGTYQEGSVCTLTAIANDGYDFVNWTKNGIMISNEATYSFVVTASEVYTANFSNDGYYTITTTNDPTIGGTTSGGGNYCSGQTCNLIATAADGYGFLYWTENNNIVTTNSSYSFDVTNNRALVAHFYELPTAPTGAIQGIFSVSDNQQVWFAQGNLQYVGSSQTWRFAANQWTVIGTSQGNTSLSTTRDLFGWGTSSWNCGNTYYKPTDTYGSTYNTSIDTMYGPPGFHDLTGDYAHSDWGVHNSISNASGQWRTLTREEWNYVLKTRNTTSGILYALARVNNVRGIIIFPDNWNENIYSINNPNPTETTSTYSDNVISSSQWTILQNSGAVFLPVTGCRNGTNIGNFATNEGGGFYWTTTAEINSSARWAYVMAFAEMQGHVYALPGVAGIGRSHGCSVRLVSPVPNPLDNKNVIQQQVKSDKLHSSVPPSLGE